MSSNDQPEIKTTAVASGAVSDTDTCYSRGTPVEPCDSACGPLSLLVDECPMQSGDNTSHDDISDSAGTDKHKPITLSYDNIMRASISSVEGLERYRRLKALENRLESGFSFSENAAVRSLRIDHIAFIMYLPCAQRVLVAVREPLKFGEVKQACLDIDITCETDAVLAAVSPLFSFTNPF